MSVNGGRPGWAAGVRFGVMAVAVGFASSACGSRTSALDPDAYDPVGASAGSHNSGGSGGSSSSAGTGSGLLGQAGAAVTPTGGAPSGVDPSLTLAQCRQYCPGYGTQCAKRLEGKDCLETCQGELNGFGAKCQAVGLATLQCLTPFFSARGGDCNAAVNRALAKCGPNVTAFDQCKKAAVSSTTTSSRVASCQRLPSSGSSTMCTDIYLCNDGPFVTDCQPSQTAKFSDCTCTTPSGAMSGARLPTTKDTCLAATQLCE